MDAFCFGEGVNRVQKRRRVVNGTVCHGNVYTVPVDRVRALLDFHLKELTLTPRESFAVGTASRPVPVKLGRVDGTFLRVPRAYGRAEFGAPETHESPIPEKIDAKFEGHLLSDRRQDEAADAALVALRDPSRNGCVLTLPCGFGKTVVSLYIAAELGVKTVVLVHTDCLFKQWQERIEQYLPGVCVGSIRGAECDTVDRDVVVAMLQSVHSHMYPEAELRSFGLVIVDEAHHICARTFAAALNRLPTRYRLGLSATPKRKDGLTQMLYWMIGPCAFCVERQDAGGARVEWKEPPRSEKLGPILLHNGKIKDKSGKPAINMAAMVNELTSDAERQKQITLDILNLVRGGRYVIVLSDRIHQLRDLSEQVLFNIEDADWLRIGSDDPQVTLCAGQFMLVGSTKKKERALVLERRLIFTTFAFAAEGLDVPRLDAAVLASPKSDVEQAVGRVMRQHPGKPDPVIVDYLDDYSVFTGMFKKRSKCYKRLHLDTRCNSQD